MRSNSMCSSYEDSPNDVKWTRCTYPILYNFNEFVVRLIIKMIKNTTINCGQCYGIFKEQFFIFLIIEQTKGEIRANILFKVLVLS